VDTEAERANLQEVAVTKQCFADGVAIVFGAGATLAVAQMKTAGAAGNNAMDTRHIWRIEAQIASPGSPDNDGIAVQQAMFLTGAAEKQNQRGLSGIEFLIASGSHGRPLLQL
jgi:hypothetical protein